MKELGRYVFVCGLHRSGTTLIAGSLANHPMATGFRNTGAIEDEGQFLQTVFPVENTFGGAGRFGFDPRAHMTEASPLNTPAAGKTLLGEWERYWDRDKQLKVEKTPSNLLRMRLLASIVEQSYFVVVTRHPIAACLATMKWTEGNLFSLMSHWVHCHRIARADSAYLKRVYWLSYEAFIREPQRELDRMTQFLRLPRHDWTVEVKDGNVAYFDLWRRQYCGDHDRAIEQLPPEHHRSIAKRIRERLARETKERVLPFHRRRKNRRNFYDALDAVALLEPAIAEFGYSFVDLRRTPAPVELQNT